MKLLNDWIPDSLLQALGWTLVHSLWQLVLIAGLLWLVLKIAHKSNPALKYLISVGALVVALGVTIGTFLIEYSFTPSSSSLTTAEVQAILSTYPPAQAQSKMEASLYSASQWVEQNIPYVVNFWFLGALLFLLRLFGNLTELNTLRKLSTPASDFHLQKLTYRLIDKMGIKSQVQLRMTESGLSPLTFGTLRPVILLPASLVFQMSPAQLEAILAHELAHVKRNDYLVNLLLSGLEVIFFYHPCYWWINQTVKELRENAADDLAIRVGIEPKNLANGLAEVLNYARQNPPQLAQAAGKKRNPTLQRIKRILGYPAQNYPQTPTISIPMLLTLLLSLGLMASAQQDAPKPLMKAATSPLTKTTPASFTAADTSSKRSFIEADGSEFFFSENNELMISDGKNSYRISGDTLYTEDGFVILSSKTKLALEELIKGSYTPIPEFEYPEAPEFYGDVDMPEFPEVDMEFPAMDFEAMPLFPMEAMPPFPMDPLAAISPMEPLDFPLEGFGGLWFLNDTLKMTPAEQEKLAKEMAVRSEKWAKIAEEKAAEWAKRSEEWAAKWQEGEAERTEKMEAWKREFEPKMKEFELKMQEWQKAQEPKMKEFELKMKEWEATQQPKMEEFQRKMEAWQKQQQAKIQEFQKLLQEELKKDNN